MGHSAEKATGRTESNSEDAAGDSGGPIANLNIGSIVAGLVKDLQDLRARRISVVEARARAQLAHEILRGITQVISAQRFIEGKARLLPSPDDAKPRGRKKKTPPFVDG